MKFFLLLSLIFIVPNTQAAKLEDYLDRKEIQKKIRETIANQDLDFDVSLGNLDLIDGINISSKYKYDVEASYINKFYTRVDKWDLSGAINVGEVLKDLVDIPFSFSVNKTSSFFFVRQFPKKLDAIKALPYTPAKLPLNAKLALKNLIPGDFVSMPANLSVAVGANVSTSALSPVVLTANTSAYFVLSGEYTVQVFKIDETHVRLKLITKKGQDAGATAGIGASFKIFGVKIIDNEIDDLFERDLAQYGLSYNPGSQFILDYVFDLKSPEAQKAYDQILSSTFKFKDLIVADMVNGKELKDKLISSYEKADALFLADQKLEPKDRRVQRIFKGFNNYRGHTRHLKFSFLVTHYIKDRTFTESKVTFIDKFENNLSFYYPTYSKYIEGTFGRFVSDLKDQSFLTNFGLIPQFNSEDSKTKNPDLGLTFERKDRDFTVFEQKLVEKFMSTQIPSVLAKDIDFSQWKDGTEKHNSRIYFQLILKSQGFEYLKNHSAEELRAKIVSFFEEKRKMHQAFESADNKGPNKLKDLLLFGHQIEKKMLLSFADSLADILKNENHNSEEMVKKLVALNEFGLFNKMGVGFLISLLPQDKLDDLVYLKLDMIGKNLSPISIEKGTLNYRALYKELNEAQSRLANRSYDLRLSDEDRNMSDLEIGHL